MLRIVETLKKLALVFCAAFAFVAGCKVADLIVNDPSLTIVICENGAGPCDRIREPVKTNWVF